MLPWALAAIRERLPEILRGAGANALADRIDRDGWDKSVLTRVERLAIAQHDRTRDAYALADEGLRWMAR
jgi:hypothetical protein